MAVTATETYGFKLGNGYFAVGDSCYSCPSTYPSGAFLPEDCFGYTAFLVPERETEFGSAMGNYLKEAGCVAVGAWAGWKAFVKKIAKNRPQEAGVAYVGYRICDSFASWLRGLF